MKDWKTEPTGFSIKNRHFEFFTFKKNLYISKIGYFLLMDLPDF